MSVKFIDNQNTAPKSTVTRKNAKGKTEVVDAPRPRASNGANAKGGSVYFKKITNKAKNWTGTRTIMTIVTAFQAKHKLSKFENVRLGFDAKAKVLHVEFVKEAIPGKTFSIDRDPSGTAYLSLTRILSQNGLRLSEAMYDDEYVFDKNGVMLVDLSDNLAKAVVIERKRGKDGRMAPYSATQKATRKKINEESVA